MQNIRDIYFIKETIQNSSRTAKKELGAEFSDIFGKIIASPVDKPQQNTSAQEVKSPTVKLPKGSESLDKLNNKIDDLIVGAPHGKNKIPGSLHIMEFNVKNFSSHGEKISSKKSPVKPTLKKVIPYTIRSKRNSPREKLVKNSLLMLSKPQKTIKGFNDKGITQKKGGGGKRGSNRTGIRGRGRPRYDAYFIIHGHSGSKKGVR